MSELRQPVTGYNHNIKHLGWEFHVQTEDSGVNNPHIITHLFQGGTILATKKLVYDPNSSADFVKELMQAQHKAVLKELKAGKQDEKIRAVLGDGSAAGTSAVADEPAAEPRAAAPASGRAATPPPDMPAPTTARADTAPAIPVTTPTVVATPSTPPADHGAALNGAARANGTAPAASAPVPTPPPTRPATQEESGLRLAVVDAMSEPPVSAAAQALVQSAPLEWITKPATWEPLAPSAGPASLPPPPASFLGRKATDPQFPSMPAAHASVPPRPQQQTPTRPVLEAFGASLPPLERRAPRPTAETTYSIHHSVSERVEMPAARAERRTTTPAVPTVSVPPGSAQLPITFPTLAELLDAWLDSGPAGGLLMDANVDARLGQDVVVFVRVLEPPRSVDLRGRVAWRRIKGHGSLRAGTGVEFQAAEKARVDGLLGRAGVQVTQARQEAPRVGHAHEPDAPHPPRAHARAAAHLAVRITTLDGDTRKETADDVSEGGMFIRSNRPPPVGSEVNVNFRAPHTWFGSHDVKGRVTWHRRDARTGYGVQFLFDGEEQQRRIEGVVAQLVAESI